MKFSWNNPEKYRNDKIDRLFDVNIPHEHALPTVHFPLDEVYLVGDGNRHFTGGLQIFRRLDISWIISSNFFHSWKVIVFDRIFASPLYSLRQGSSENEGHLAQCARRRWNTRFDKSLENYWKSGRTFSRRLVCPRQNLYGSLRSVWSRLGAVYPIWDFFKVSFGFIEWDS